MSSLIKLGAVSEETKSANPAKDQLDPLGSSNHCFRVTKVTSGGIY